MQEAYEKSLRRINSTSLGFTRGIMESINWDARLIGIKGARGVGKTTLLLQYIRKNISDSNEALYISLDNLWFAQHKLHVLTDDFVKKGGKYLFIDEVHKYPDWSVEIKNIYDDYPELKIVFTGSSLLEILNARADLSRRALVYSMQGLSYREYLNLTQGTAFPVISLKELLEDTSAIATEINHMIKPLQYFQDYLTRGYFPFFNEGTEFYHQRLEEIANMILEIELPMLRNVEISYVPKLKQLLRIIAETAPFMPNVSKLSEKININRNTLSTYLFFLQQAHLIHNLYRNSKGITRLQKPDKIFLENTNYMYAFAPENVNTGNLRETFFINQLSNDHRIEYTDNGDFRVDGHFIFEIGGKGKNKKQILNIPNSYIAADNLEYGNHNTIPLWMFGFLY